MESPKESTFFLRIFKSQLKRREVLRKKKDYDKGRKGKSQNRFSKFFARNSGAHFLEN